MSDIFFWLAFQPVGLILLGVIVAAAFAFIVWFIVRTYRLRQSPQRYAALIASLAPIEPPVPDIPERLAEALAEDLPPTHYTPRSPWRHS